MIESGKMVSYWDTGLSGPKIGLVINVQVAGGHPFVYLYEILSQTGEIVHMVEDDVKEWDEKG